MSETDSKRDEGLILREALDHSWSWFSLHAGQRMQAVNFFLLTSGFLTSAYSVALSADKPEVAGAIGAIGVLVTVYFQRLEIRTKELVKAGEAALRPSQELLARQTGIAELEILQVVETPSARFSSYGVVIRALQFTVGLAFALGVGLAVVEAA